MKKVYKLEDLDCAHCASKIEEAVGKLEGVGACTVSFLSQKMTLDMEEGKESALMKDIKKIVKKFEPDVSVEEM